MMNLFLNGTFVKCHHTNVLNKDLTRKKALYVSILEYSYLEGFVILLPKGNFPKKCLKNEDLYKILLNTITNNFQAFSKLSSISTISWFSLYFDS